MEFINSNGIIRTKQPIVEFDKSIQEQILCLLVRDQKFLIEYGSELITTELFTNFYYKVVYEKIISYFNTYGSVPIYSHLIALIDDYCNSVKAKEHEKVIYHDIIYNIYNKEIYSQEFIIDLVLKHSKRVAFNKAVIEAKNLLDNFTEENFQTAYAIINKALLVGTSRKQGSTLDDIDAFISVYDKLFTGKSVITTTFPTLDKYLLGGMVRGQLFVWVAPPNRGKSTIMRSQCASYLRKGYNVAVFTLETEDEEYMFDIATNLAQLGHIDYINNKEAFKQTLKKVASDSNFGRIFCQYYPQNSVNINSLRSYLSRLKVTKDFKPDIILVDYADLLQPTSGSDTMYQSGGSIYSDLIKLASDFECPIITASQPKVQYWDGDNVEIIPLDGLANSSQKGQNAHTVVSLNQTSKEYEAGRLRAAIIKARRGIRHKVVNLAIDYRINYVYDIDAQESDNSNIDYYSDFEDSIDEIDRPDNSKFTRKIPDPIDTELNPDDGYPF